LQSHAPKKQNQAQAIKMQYIIERKKPPKEAIISHYNLSDDVYCSIQRIIKQNKQSKTVVSVASKWIDYRNSYVGNTGFCGFKVSS